MINPFTQGPRALITKLNMMVKVLNALSNLRGDGLIQVTKSDAGYTLKLAVDQVNARMPKGRGGGGGNIRMCWLAEDPTNDYPLCYFDTEDSETTDNVRFLIASSGASATLSTAIPEMKKGDPVLVTSVKGEWFAIPPWNAGEPCPS